METCTCCGNLLLTGMISAWRGGLYCNRECVVTHAKKSGIYDLHAANCIELESEDIMCVDIGINMLDYIPQEDIDKLLNANGYYVTKAQSACGVYENECIECSNGTNIKFVFSYKVLKTMLAN